MKKRTVGILGLSGDPSHLGHIAMAQAAKDRLQLDEVWLMVTPHNPFKDLATATPVEHRLHLAHLAARESGQLGDWLKVSEFEVLLRRFDKENATINLLQHFSEAYPLFQPVWLMGSDNFANVHTWGGHWNQIFEDYPVGVFARPRSTRVAQQSFAARAFASGARDEASFRAEPSTWCFMNGVSHPASSTRIRKQVREGNPSPDYLPAASMEYIRRVPLYGCPRPSGFL